MIRLVTLFTSFILFIPCFAIQPPVNNATSLALGGASATYKNAFAIENNVAALAFNRNTLAFNGQNRFGISDYSYVGFCGNLKIDNTVLGFGIYNSPLSNLNIQKYQLAFAKKLKEELSVGIALNYHCFSSTNAYYKTGNTFTFNLGIYYQINDKLNLGFNSFNPNRSLITELPKERLDAVYRIGIDYLLTKSVILYSDFVQSSSQNLSFHGGIEVEQNQFILRGGFNTNQEVSLGLGFQKNNFSFDVGTSYHNALGISPSLNLNYAF